MPLAVFDLGLSVEAVSLFLMVESLEGSQIDKSQNCTAKSDPVTTQSCLDKWNAQEGDFKNAVKELVARNVISADHSKLKILSSDVWITK
ncbi:MAG: hypothetical protein BA863_05305 [Desulfovibrio sp. S3730MH75]|nr:MAG: hypothetical protein BA863_05305 [Desulfovibrio sp. S3730MH75]